MIVGTVKEIMNNEHRVGLTSSSVRDLTEYGHTVIIETGAGINSGITDESYIKAGAKIVSDAKSVWNSVDLLVKVKEPLESEYKYFREGLTLFCFLHLSAHADLTKALMDSKTNAIAFETVETENRDLPCLKPMSSIAGRMSAIIGAEYLQKNNGGSGVLISGLPGVARAKAVVVGAGNVGENALKMLVGLGAYVTILDVNFDKLSHLDDIYQGKIQTLFSNSENLEKAISDADIVIGAISLPGLSTPKLIKRSYYKNMRKGSVIVDVAIDQGGSTEVSRITSHDNPTFEVDGINHYCVANIPGAVPLTATVALSNATIGYIMKLTKDGVVEACKNNYALKMGANVINGLIVNKNVAKSLELEYHEL